MESTRIGKKIILLACCFFPLLLGGCSDKPELISTSHAAVRRTFTIGLIPEVDIFAQKKRYEPLACYLSSKLDINVELKILSRYGNVIDNFVSEGMDAAFFGSFTGALALKKLGVIPLVRPEGGDGVSTYYGMIFARKDSAIKTAADMKGKRFACVDKATTAGWLLPLHFFKEIGITDFGSWFGEVYFAGTHEDAIYDVLNRDADMGAAKNTVFYRFAAQDSRVKNELEILATSPRIPENGLAVRSGYDKNMLIRLKKVLLDMERDPAGQGVLKKFGAARFIETHAADYQVVVDFASSVGVDMASYQYTNN